MATPPSPNTVMSLSKFIKLFYTAKHVLFCWLVGKKIGSCKAVCELKQLESSTHCLSDARKTMNEKLQSSENPEILISREEPHMHAFAMSSI